MTVYTGPSGQIPPATDLPGWVLRYCDDFTTDPGSKLCFYRDGTPDTAKTGRYNRAIVSTHDSVLDLCPQTLDGTPTGIAVGYEPGGTGQWAASGQLYGRWAMRWRADPVAGYAFTGLLWPVSNTWAEGEIDWPEGALTSTLKGFVHQVGKPKRNAATVDTKQPMGDGWHTTVVEWTPGHVVCYLDDEPVLASNQAPVTPMRWTIQLETAYGAVPDPTVAGHVQIDWLAAWTCS